MEKSCRSCNQAFTVGEDDLAFYDKVSPVFNGRKESLPPPSMCPDCRAVHRYLWRNEFSRYNRTCAATGKELICPYSPDKPFMLYSQDAWWAETWSGLEYGRDFDFTRPFFDQMRELLAAVPVMATYNLYGENSGYCDWCSYLKNCYLLSSSNGDEDSYYGRLVNHSVSCVDCFSVRDCELCYDCTECEKCYNVAYSQNSYRCTDCYFLVNCLGCQDCFGCVNLRQAQYVWCNEQLTKEEYQARLAKWQSGSYANVMKGKAWLSEFRKQFPVRSYNGENNEDSSGNFINNCKNAKHCFDCFDLEDSKYCSQMFQSRDCHDMLTWGRPGEMLYSSTATGDHAYRNAFCVTCANNREILYCVQCMNSDGLFGCVGLKKERYCILNKKYAKEEYESLVHRIIEHMRMTGEWGEFFPPALSPFGYNETIAQDYAPTTKDEALKKGYNWSDYVSPPPQVEKTVKASQIPDNISAIPDAILDWAVECEVTGRPFRIIKQELRFLREHRIPLPRRHPDIRYQDRLALRNPRLLFDRRCATCARPIETSYAPDCPEKVLCSECYLKEVY